MKKKNCLNFKDGMLCRKQCMCLLRFFDYIHYTILSSQTHKMASYMQTQTESKELSNGIPEELQEVLDFFKFSHKKSSKFKGNVKFSF